MKRVLFFALSLTTSTIFFAAEPEDWDMCTDLEQQATSSGPHPKLSQRASTPIPLAVSQSQRRAPTPTPAPPSLPSPTAVPKALLLSNPLPSETPGHTDIFGPHAAQVLTVVIAQPETSATNMAAPQSTPANTSESRQSALTTISLAPPEDPQKQIKNIKQKQSLASWCAGCWPCKKSRKVKMAI